MNLVKMLSLNASKKIVHLNIFQLVLEKLMTNLVLN